MPASPRTPAKDAIESIAVGSRFKLDNPRRTGTNVFCLLDAKQDVTWRGLGMSGQRPDQSWPVPGEQH
jgi:hypothetical protein